MWPWWLLAGLVGGLAAAIGAEAISRVVLLDLIAGWPVLAVLLVLALVGAFRSRSGGVVAMVLNSFLVVMVGIHVGGWVDLPSRAGDIRVSLPEQTEEAVVRLELDRAQVRLAGGADHGYGLIPLRAGGSVGVPRVVESLAAGHLRLLATPRLDSEWFLFSGWRVELGAGSAWSLEFSGDDLEVDLGSVPLAAVAGEGSGRVRLGSQPTRISLDGDYTVVAPLGAVGVVIGVADVPVGWSVAADGSMVDGDGWVVEVLDGEVEIVEESVRAYPWMVKG